MLSNYVSLRSMFRVVMSVTISAYKRCLVRLYLQLFVGGLMSYIRYLCLFMHSGVQMHCVVLRLVCHWCQFLWIVHFWLSLRYSLTLFKDQHSIFYSIHVHNVIQTNSITWFPDLTYITVAVWNLSRLKEIGCDWNYFYPDEILNVII